MTREGLLVVAAALAMLIAGCGGDGGTGPGRSLTLSPAALSLGDCGAGAMSASVRDGNGNPVSATITFTSRDPQIASVNASGSVTGQGVGSTYIVVVSQSLSDSVPVTVAAGPETLTAPQALIVNHLSTGAIGAAMIDCHGEPTATTITYQSDNASVATVSPDGVISGVTLGAVTITVQSGIQQKSVAVDVVGSPTRSSVVPVSVNNLPFGVAISRLGAVYVTQIASNTMVRSDVPVTAFSDTVSVGSAAAHVAFNPAGTKAYVTNQFGSSLSVVDVASGLEQLQIPLGHSAFNVLVAPGGATVYATVDMGNVYLINTATNVVADSFNAGPIPNGLAFSPDGTRLYISSRDGGWVVVYDTLAHRMIDTLMTGGMPQRIAVSRDGTELYIANEMIGLDIWSVTTASRIISLPIGGNGGYGLALSPDNSAIYVSSPTGGTVEIIDRATRTDIGSIPTGGKPRNIAFSRFGDEALIANESGFVTVVH